MIVCFLRNLSSVIYLMKLVMIKVTVIFVTKAFAQQEWAVWNQLIYQNKYSYLCCLQPPSCLPTASRHQDPGFFASWDIMFWVIRSKTISALTVVMVTTMEKNFKGFVRIDVLNKAKRAIIVIQRCLKPNRQLLLQLIPKTMQLHH